MRRLRDSLVVALHDLRDSLRSRRALIFLLLYMAGATAAAGIFISVLRDIENALADTLRVGHTDTPGAMTQGLMDSPQFLKVVAELLGDNDLAADLVKMPPLALFYGALAFTLIPMLVAFTSGESIASELASGSCRFALFRTDRTAWALGKLLGQAALMAVGILSGAVGTWVVGYFFLGSFDPAEAALWLLRLSFRAWFLGFAWLGAITGVSQLTRSVPWSRVLALGVLVVGGLSSTLLQSAPVTRRVPVLASTVLQLYPSTYRLDLWRPELVERLPAMVMLFALGVVAFTLGHQRFLRRDL